MSGTAIATAVASNEFFSVFGRIDNHRGVFDCVLHIASLVSFTHVPQHYLKRCDALGYRTFRNFSGFPSE